MYSVGEILYKQGSAAVTANTSQIMDNIQPTPKPNLPVSQQSLAVAELNYSEQYVAAKLKKKSLF